MIPLSYPTINRILSASARRTAWCFLQHCHLMDLNVPHKWWDILWVTSHYNHSCIIILFNAIILQTKCSFSYIIVFQNFTSWTSWLFVASNPNACLIQMHNCKTTKLYASLDWFSLLTPLHGLKMVEGKAYALSAITKKNWKFWH